MVKHFCDICGQEIKTYEIPVRINLMVGDKMTTVDFHSTCYYQFIRDLKEKVEDLNEE